ncbi:MAG: hypothetical protein QXW70_02910 [Candidatus Anstonellales archaeon]
MSAEKKSVEESDPQEFENDMERIRIAEEEASKILSEATKKGESIILEAKEKANKIIDEAREKAIAEKNRIIEEGRKNIEKEKRAIIASSRMQAKKLSSRSLSLAYARKIAQELV